MFRIFSTLRRLLLSEGKFRTYLVYAVGELALVVVGILIALQIDSWADDRRDQAFERETLMQIHRNLASDHAELQTMIDNRRRAVQSVDSILAIANTDDPGEDLPRRLADVFQFDRFFAITNAYEVLKSRGLDLVRNDDLRLTLGIYYDGWSREILQHNADLERGFFEHWMPRLVNDFERFDWDVASVPTDAAALLRDRRFLNTLRLERENHAGAAEQLEEMIAVNEKLQGLIEQETGR